MPNINEVVNHLTTYQKEYLSAVQVLASGILVYASYKLGKTTKWAKEEMKKNAELSKEIDDILYERFNYNKDNSVSYNPTQH